MSHSVLLHQRSICFSVLSGAQMSGYDLRKLAFLRINLGENTSGLFCSVCRTFTASNLTNWKTFCHCARVSKNVKNSEDYVFSLLRFTLSVTQTFNNVRSDVAFQWQGMVDWQLWFSPCLHAFNLDGWVCDPQQTDFTDTAVDGDLTATEVCAHEEVYIVSRLQFHHLSLVPPPLQSHNHNTEISFPSSILPYLIWLELVSTDLK